MKFTFLQDLVISLQIFESLKLSSQKFLIYDFHKSQFVFKIHVKNMVCPRCIDSVCEALNEQGVTYYSVKLGEVEVREIPSGRDLRKLKKNLRKRGFEYLMDKDTELVNSVKSFLIEKIHYSKETDSKLNLSEELSRQLKKDYSTISRTFSKIEKSTIEQFVKAQKIERVKELISYDQLNLSEIAYEVGYGSISHLSNQFKDQVGMSPSEFKKLNEKPRNSLDNL